MTKKTKNILLITSAILIIGVGTYFYFKKNKRTKITDKTEKEAGETVREWKDLKKNLPDYLPTPELNFEAEKTLADGTKLSEKIYPFYFLGILDTKDPKKAERLGVYYYADGDFRIYHSTWNADKKTYDNEWMASGRWLNKTGTKVKIEPRNATLLKTYPIEKGTYEGVNLKDMLSKIVGSPVGYYDAESKIYKI